MDMDNGLSLQGPRGLCCRVTRFAELLKRECCNVTVGSNCAGDSGKSPVRAWPELFNMRPAADSRFLRQSIITWPSPGELLAVEQQPHVTGSAEPLQGGLIVDHLKRARAAVGHVAPAAFGAV